MSEGRRNAISYEVIRGSRDDSCYRYVLRNTMTGAESPAYLTNELFPNPSPDRTLLLCADPSIITNRRERALFDDLANMLRANKSERTGQTKSIVNDIVDGRLPLENVRIAVHKFGPVPVLVLDGDVELAVHGRSIVARIAMFPKYDRTPIGPAGQGQLLPFFTSSRVEFRKSMTVAPHLTFRRYFEDVAEDFHDIRRTVQPHDIYRRAKTAERRLAESVRGKLEILIPKAPLNRKCREVAKREAWEVFEGIAGTLYEAALARAQGLFLLNEVYQLIGIASRSAHYRARMDEHGDHFVRLLGAAHVREIVQSSRVLPYLFELQRRYESIDLLHHDFAVAADLLEFAADAPVSWCGEYVKFAAFALIGRKLAGTKDTTRVFISHHHDVPASKFVREQIAAQLTALQPRSVLPLAITELPPGSPARHVVRSAIWLSHGTIAICPAETRHITTHVDKNYKWIAREGEYSLLLKKRVLFGTEHGTELSTVLADFQDPRVGYLVRGSKLPPDEVRAAELTKHFQERVRTEFRVTSMDTTAHMDPRLKTDVSHFAKEVRVRHAELLLDGYVNQFDPETHRLLIFVLSFLGPLGKRARPRIVSTIAKRLKNGNEPRANAAFTNMWRQVKDRRLLLGNRAVGMIELQLPEKRRYSERLTAVIRVLLPEMNSSARKAWRHAWLARQSRDLQISLPGR